MCSAQKGAALQAAAGERDATLLELQAARGKAAHLKSLEPKLLAAQREAQAAAAKLAKVRLSLIPSQPPA